MCLFTQFNLLTKYKLITATGFGLNFELGGKKASSFFSRAEWRLMKVQQVP